MANTERLILEIVADTTQANRAIGDLKTTGGKHGAAAGKGFGDAFARNFGASIRDFSEGRGSFALVRLTEAFAIPTTALAGIFALVALYQQLTERIVKAREEQQKLDNELGVAGLAQRGGSISSLQSSNQELAKSITESRGSMTRGGEMLDEFVDTVNSAFNDFNHFIGEPFEDNAKIGGGDQERIRAAQEAISQNNQAITARMADQADYAEKIAKGREKEAGYLKVAREAEEARAAIRMAPHIANTDRQQFEQIMQINRLETARTQQLVRQEGIERMRQDAEENIARATGTAMQRENAAIGERIKLAKQLMNIETDGMRIQHAKTELIKAAHAAEDSAYKQSRKSQNQRREDLRERHAHQRFARAFEKGLVHRKDIIDAAGGQDALIAAIQVLANNIQEHRLVVTSR